MRFIWADIETTGLDVATTAVLEVAAIVLDENLDEVGNRFHAVIHSDPEWWDDVDDYVDDMHTKNGLKAASLNSVLPEMPAAKALDEWVKYQADGDTALCGSGVVHFDRRLMQERAWEVESRFTYWVIDVGILRRGLQYLGVETPYVEESFGDGKAHRAMQDVEAHIAEYRAIGQALLQK